jgi:hypothetical protein
MADWGFWKVMYARSPESGSTVAGTALCWARIWAMHEIEPAGSGACQLNRDAVRVLFSSDSLGPNVDDIARRPEGNAQTSALANRESLDSRMLSHDSSLEIDDRAGGFPDGPAFAYESEVIVVGHEADILAVRLVVHRQTVLLRNSPDLSLGVAADREKHVRKQLAPESEQNIRLILGAVEGPRHAAGAIARLANASVMTGRNEVGSDLFAVGPKLAKLEPDVADDAWIGRAAGNVFVGKIILDPRKVALEIERVERDVDPIRDPFCIDCIGGAATGLGPTLGIINRCAGAHEDADDVVALFLEQHSGDRTVDTATHRQNDPFSIHRSRLIKKTN